MAKKSSDRGKTKKLSKKPLKKKVWTFGVNFHLDYKDVNTIRKFINEKGKILTRRQTGASAKHQRVITVAVKRARQMALVQYPNCH